MSSHPHLGAAKVKLRRRGDKRHPSQSRAYCTVVGVKTCHSPTTSWRLWNYLYCTLFSQLMTRDLLRPMSVVAISGNVSQSRWTMNLTVRIQRRFQHYSSCCHRLQNSCFFSKKAAFYWYNIRPPRPMTITAERWKLEQNFALKFGRYCEVLVVSFGHVTILGTHSLWAANLP